MTIQAAYEAVRKAAQNCTSCGACMKRCEVLEEEAKSAGGMATSFIAAVPTAPTSADDAAFHSAVKAFADATPGFVFAIRRCCMCDYCTLSCPDDVSMRVLARSLRELFAFCGVTGTDGFEVTQVDGEWDIFKAYRAIYGITFEGYTHLGTPEAVGCDTLFFPGCSLESYMPSVTRKALDWLIENGFNVALCEECCGSPLVSAGWADRCTALKSRIAGQICEAGIKRIVFVCPGCRDEFEQIADLLPGIELVSLARLMADAGVQVSEDACEASLCIFDSCHDRDGRFGSAIRALFPKQALELPDHGSEALCCGAAGSVSLVDPAICSRRTCKPLLEARDIHADVIVDACPTCSYTFADAIRKDTGALAGVPVPLNYLELVFDERTDWEDVFGKLESMWSGEYGPWLSQTFFS